MEDPRSTTDSTVLIVDDDLIESRALISSLERRALKCSFVHANSAATAIEIANRSAPAVAVVDLSLDDSSGPTGGLDLIQSLLKLNRPPRILVLTGHSDESFGIRSLRLGAASFIRKPVDPDHLAALLSDAIEYSALLARYRALQEESSAKRLGSLTSKNVAMQRTLERAHFAAQSGQNVFIVGETGTGKGVLAQAISELHPPPRGMFVRFQPGFGNFDLVSSELFGHERGAFTGATETRRGILEDANRGTLFIDEVDELPNQTQVLLLNAIQEGVFRRIGSNRELRSQFRLICASNRPLAEIQNGTKLRPDFYHRIAHVVLTIPPLRERPEDIEELALELLRKTANEYDLSVFALTPEALRKLQEYSWPGNIRELQAIISNGAHLASFHGRQLITPEDIEFSSATSKGAVGTFRSQVQRFELEIIRNALKITGENQSAAAAMLQLDRSTLRRILSRNQD